MNVQRASDISQSPDMKHVTYQGKRIYIQNVDDQKGTARVYALDDPMNEFDVQVQQLEESH